MQRGELSHALGFHQGDTLLQSQKIKPKQRHRPVLCTAVEIDDNWVPVLQGRFIPEPVLPLGFIRPAAGHRVPGERGGVLSTAAQRALLHPPESDSHCVLRVQGDFTLLGKMRR